MSKQVQFRRCDTATLAGFTGADGELTVDTDKKVVVVHDGATAGGTPMAKEADIPAIVDNLTSTSATSALSAKQGKSLQDNKVNTADIINDLTHTDTNKPLSAAQGKALNDTKANQTLTDAGDYYTIKTPEGALQEVGAQLADIVRNVGNAGLLFVEDAFVRTTPSSGVSFTYSLPNRMRIAYAVGDTTATVVGARILLAEKIGDLAGRKIWVKCTNHNEDASDNHNGYRFTFGIASSGDYGNTFGSSILNYDGEYYLLSGDTIRTGMLALTGATDDSPCYVAVYNVNSYVNQSPYSLDLEVQIAVLGTENGIVFANEANRVNGVDFVGIQQMPMHGLDADLIYAVSKETELPWLSGYNYVNSSGAIITFTSPYKTLSIAVSPGEIYRITANNISGSAYILTVLDELGSVVFHQKYATYDDYEYTIPTNGVTLLVCTVSESYMIVKKLVPTNALTNFDDLARLLAGGEDIDGWVVGYVSTAAISSAPTYHDGFSGHHYLLSAVTPEYHYFITANGDGNYYSIVLVDADGNVTRRFNLTSTTIKRNLADYEVIIRSDEVSMIVNSADAGPYYVRRAQYADMESINRRIKTIEGIGITFWGDSLTSSGGWTTILQTLMGYAAYEVLNAGTGGENVRTIAARQGADVMTVNGITIPADLTPVVIADRDVDTGIDTLFGYKATPLLQGGTAHVNPCYIGDVEGTLTWTGASYDDMTGDWTFTRTESGDAVTIDRPTALRTYADREKNVPYLMVIFMGQNGGYTDDSDLVRMHRLMMEHAKAKHCLILGLSSGSAADRADYEAAMRAEFGRYFVSLREYLAHPIYDTDGVTIISCYGLADAGLTATSADLAAIATGTVPPQLLSDGTHYTTATKTVIGNMLYQVCKDLNIA